MKSDKERQYEKIINLGNMRKMDKIVWPTLFNRDNYTAECKAFHRWKALLFSVQIGGTWMHTFLTTVALIVAAPAATWEISYSNGQQLAAAQHKPLVVVFAPGANGWTKVVRAEAPAKELTKILAEQYVCVFIDTATPQGNSLAQNFDISGGVGMVISDRHGGSQAFWHQGDLPND